MIDEFGQFGNENIVGLLNLARSAKLGIVLATQDVGGLGNCQRMILANTRTKILMSTDYPEEIASLAGTRYQVESSIAHENSTIIGKGSARIQHTFKINMNEVVQLAPGEAYIIQQRYIYRIKLNAIFIGWQEKKLDSTGHSASI